VLNNEQQKTPKLTSRDDWQVLTSEEYQEEMANRTSEEITREGGDAGKMAGVMESFLLSYAKHKSEIQNEPEKLKQWLEAEFKQYPAIWKSDEELQSTAREVVDNIEIANQKKTSLQAHLDQGKSQASWLATEIEKSATANGAANIGSYAAGIDQALGQANQKNWDAITRMDGFISQSPNLDGFIAEHHHANTFNLNAEAQGSAYRAKVLEPKPGETYSKNSMDIGIYDGNGKLVKRYQAKYGTDAEATAELHAKGDYRGQKLLVPEGQGKDIPGSTEVIEIDDIKSKPLSKDEAKALQNKAQQEHEAKQYEWNEVNRISVAKQIGKQALAGACITAGFQGVRILSRRLWNSMNGKANTTANEDLQEFFESSIKGSAHVGVQVAVSGAVVVAVKNGWLGTVLKNTPAGRIVNMVHIGLENAKVLFKLNNGEISSDEALDAMGRTTVSAAAAIAGAVEGAALGATYGTVFGPIGTFVGGFVGGMAGGLAGSKIGEAVYEGGKKIVKAAGAILRDVASGVGRSLAAIGNGLRSLIA